MTKLLKSLFLAIGLVVILLVILIAALLLLVDPRALAPKINDYLEPYALQANFNGDIGWQLFPQVGIAMDQVSLSSLDDKSGNSEDALIEVDSFSTSIALLPLLSKRIDVQGIHLSGLDTNIHIDKQGNSPLLDALEKMQSEGGEAPQEPAPEAEQSSLDKLNIDNITLTDINISYQDARTGAQYTISDLAFSAENINLDKQGLSIQVSSHIAGSDLPSLSLNLDGEMAISGDEQSLLLKRSNLQIEALTQQAETVSLQATGDLSWKGPLSGKFDMKLGEFNAKQLLQQLNITPPETQSASALTQLKGQWNLAIDNEQYTIDLKSFSLDESTLSGKLSYQADKRGKPVVNSTLSLDKINLDHYLPPEAAEAATSDTSTETAPSPLPLDAIRNNTLQASINVGELIVKKQALNNIELVSAIKNQRAEVSRFDAKLNDGSLSGKMALDASASTAKLSGSVDSQNIDLGETLKNMADFSQLNGTANSRAQFRSSGNTDQALIDNLSASFESDSPSLSVLPINLEKYFCEAMNLLQKKESDISWPDVMPIENIKTQINYQNKRVELKTFNASVQDISTSANGKLNLDTGKFSFPFELSLANFAAGDEKCGGISEKWRKQAIPLVCSGNYSSIDFKTCRVNSKRLTDMIAANIKSAANEKINEEKAKVKEKVDSELEKQKQKLEERKKEETQKLKNKLNDLFN